MQPIKVINVFDTGTGTEEVVLEPSLEETKEEVVIVEDIVDNLEIEWQADFFRNVTEKKAWAKVTPIIMYSSMLWNPVSQDQTTQPTRI